MKHLILVAALGACIFASIPSYADTRIKSPDGNWQAITTREGCRFAMHTGDFFLAVHQGAPNATFTWSGRCTADKMISGSGRLIYQFTGEHGQFREELAGTATDGMFEGATEQTTFSNWDDFDDKTPPGAMVLHDGGDVRNPMPSFYRNGCAHYVDSENRVSPAPSPEDCVAAGGAAFRKSLTGSNAGGTSAPHPATGVSETSAAHRNAAAGSTSSEPAGAALQDRLDGSMPSSASRSTQKGEKRLHVPSAVASKCLSLKEGPGFGGLVNSCDYAVSYTYCAEHPEKGAWTEAFDCDKGRNGLGSDVVGANNTSGSHTKGAKHIHWVACKYKKPDDLHLTADVKWDAQKRMLTFRCSE